LPTERSTADSSSPDQDAEPTTLGRELERTRLEHRARQLERVIERLRFRVRAGSDAGQPERAGLQRAMADFSSELREVRRQLGEVAEPLNATR
jgi:hypothetical protein